MLPILEQLLVIQDRDRRIAELKREQARVPQQLEAVDARVRDESSRLETARQELKHIEAERKKLEIEADSKRAQILKYRGQLSLIKSNTEYQALLKEIAKAEAEIREIEDRELEFMERVEQIQSDVKQEQALVKELTSKAEAEKADLQKRGAAIADRTRCAARRPQETGGRNGPGCAEPVRAADAQQGRLCDRADSQRQLRRLSLAYSAAGRSQRQARRRVDELRILRSYSILAGRIGSRSIGIGSLIFDSNLEGRIAAAPKAFGVEESPDSAGRDASRKRGLSA